ncbi:DHA2 family lincomycin resistance protein-like MFS transporter [Homoserinimonas aerilata]|uniref:DHA2 family lincomycin resistance protein-like MFS transporter n=1 Tax=Homoserinimonas aerilata TaxID=1162970 RepID=A0A542YJC2_9MICO|nr:MDR family MFS transporter [Homoserinimonas aerilata]TQL48183.1 DHA2 family lincomycin resistance protein-like MFS transporter [Homoserinimonas aerilata]
MTDTSSSTATGAVPVPNAASLGTAPSTEAEARIASRNRLVIGLLLVSAFVVILNETVLGVAQTRLEHDLGVPYSLIQWLTTGFMLTMAVVIPITGFLLERFTTRGVFITAMSLFSLGTLICALAPGFEVLLAGRIVQATGTAIMMPLLMTTVMNLVPPSARGRTMGNISIVISVAPALGPTISGLILNVLEWRWLFLLVLPIAIGALVLGAARIENVTEPRKVPVDSLSVVLSALGFGGLIFGLSSLGEAARGAATVPLWIPIGVGIAALVLFVLRQRRLQRSDRALLDLRTFLSPVFSVSTIMLVISMIALFGMVVVLPIYTQEVLGLDTLTTGLLLLPGGLLMGVMAPFVGRFYDRFGPAPLVVPGSIIVSGALWGTTLLGVDTPFLWVLVAHVALSIGLALLFTPLFTSALGSLRPSLYSHGSAIVGTVQQLAGAAGTALFISVMTAQSIALAGGGAPDVADTAGGIHMAFVCGAVISLLAVVAAFFVRKPADMPEGMHAGH